MFSFTIIAAALYSIGVPERQDDEKKKTPTEMEFKFTAPIVKQSERMRNSKRGKTRERRGGRWRERETARLHRDHLFKINYKFHLNRHLTSLPPFGAHIRIQSMNEPSQSVSCLLSFSCLLHCHCTFRGTQKLYNIILILLYYFLRHSATPVISECCAAQLRQSCR